MNKGDPITKEKTMTKYMVYWTEKHLFQSEPIEATDSEEALALHIAEQNGMDRGDPPEAYHVITEEVEIEEVKDD